MPSTYNYLGIQLMETGEKAGTWGTLTNTNWNIIQQATSGYHEQTIAGGVQTTALLITDGDSTSVTDALTNAGRNQILQLTGTITGNQIVTFPTSTEGLHLVLNGTSGVFTVQLKGASDSGSGTTFSTTDKGYKLIYMSGTDLVDVGAVTLTGTQTLTNKTLTSPKIVTSILDTNGLELALLTATGSAVNEFTIANAAAGAGPILSSTGDETNVDLNLNPKGAGVLKSGTAAVKIAGTETMWVPATAMYAASTNGAEAAQEELTAGNPELKTFDFDASTAESVQFNVSFPKSWNEGTVTFQTFWSASSTDTGTGGFTLAGCSVASDVDYDLAFGTPVANTALAASGTQDDLMVNVVSGDVTIASAAAATNTIFRLVRDTGTDTNTGDLRLVGAKIFYTTDAANDA